uniref:Secreted protein n=1 Tax=Rhipicephalus appendiculatus TaxID=34631 RepID=A0A131YC65_RHIAP
MSIQSACALLGMRAYVLLVYCCLEEHCIGWLLRIVNLKARSKLPCHAVKPRMESVRNSLSNAICATHCRRVWAMKVVAHL